METVSFIHMADGSKEDYDLLARYEEDYAAGLPGRLLDTLQALDQSFGGYQVSRLEHSLQSATRAWRNNESEELIVAALLHDIGDVLAPYAHGEYAAAILRPYVSDKIYWIIKHHGVFQMVYYAHHYGEDRYARERFKEHPYYQDTIRFCELYDQNCFDPDYESQPLSFFAPMVARLFSRRLQFNDTN